MHRRLARKTLTPYSVSDTRRVLQTAVAKFALGRCIARAIARYAKRPDFTGFLARPADRRAQSRVAGFGPLPLCPCRSLLGIEEGLETAPPSLVPWISRVAKKPIKSAFFELRDPRSRVANFAAPVCKNRYSSKNAIWHKAFRRGA